MTDTTDAATTDTADYEDVVAKGYAGVRTDPQPDSHYGAIQDPDNPPTLHLTMAMPASGPKVGGTHVSVYGWGFTPQTEIVFGTKPAGSVRYVSDTQLDAVAPGGSGSDLDLKATDGEDSTDLGGFWTYQ